ncbi:hypothetical protein CYLTODRAFT_419257 [Cylindrobasidium torrendii FP15055 ss-10]|uniref:AGC-kinase C-terminal domain-containing protein n=1 Tax=Cylindrobasidium torrendii FP15055 ss-10 TaxID=1314674 RepID=A0A0D7BLG1_9AGAR|nr:hypothetical protein CYLTODRAFT_419257 [Cylindrobasidium torrendii FP15055 ss-10]
MGSVFYPAPRSQNLPRYNAFSSSSAVQEKIFERRQANSRPWFVPVAVPIPACRSRALRLWFLNPQRLRDASIFRLGYKRGSLLLLVMVTMVVIWALGKRFATDARKWPAPFTDPSTLVFRREDLQKVYLWEIESGHYPSRRKIPEGIALRTAPGNPALPTDDTRLPPPRLRPTPGGISTTTTGKGPHRHYPDLRVDPPNVAYPPRPISGSVADLDIVMEHCDFSDKKYVRDCLQILRTGAGLDNNLRVRRGNRDAYKYIYTEEALGMPEHTHTGREMQHTDAPSVPSETQTASDSGLSKKRGVDWEAPLMLRPAPPYVPHASLRAACDPESPRIFHMFWTGPFTDKPYLALLSFLYTQNTGLHTYQQIDACRPQFWLWINPGPASSVLNPSALTDMFDELKANPWASPFLHPRFKDVIKFKMWNTTEQLDGVPEIKDEWRLSATLFNSGGHAINVPARKSGSAEDSTSSASKEDDMLNRLGSKSSSTYDRLSVILSDMARFVLCHRFGGIYLDADTIFLRDWEELWGWKGAFAYRWSRLEKYNTAVLHMNKQSALGTFLFRTALKNNLDFHPMTVSRYMKDAHLENLLLRLPDALFDSAWLNTEYYQRDRPPQPYFQDFSDLFDTPPLGSAAPEALGFDGFFKGAFSYHFHNFWWKPFDVARNFPDLGPRFAAGEKIARNATAARLPGQEDAEEPEDLNDMPWATVLKRTFESYLRQERPNLYGEWLVW